MANLWETAPLVEEPSDTPLWQSAPSLDEPSHASGLRAQIDVPEQTEPRSNLRKAAFNFGAGIHTGFADAMEFGGRITDMMVPNVGVPGPGPAQKIGMRIGRYSRGAGEDLQTVADATPGNEIVSTIAQGAGSMVPTAIAAAISSIVGVPGAAAGITAGALQGGGSAYRHAKEYLSKLGLSDDEADAVANKVGLTSGAITGAVTRYTPQILSKIPGVGRYLGDQGVEAWANRFLVDRMKTLPGWGEAVKRVAGAASGEGIEEASDQIGQAVIGKLTDRPELGVGQALAEVGIAGLAGGLTAGLLKGPIDFARTATGQVQRDYDAAVAETDPALGAYRSQRLNNAAIQFRDRVPFVQNLRPEPPAPPDVFVPPYFPQPTTQPNATSTQSTPVGLPSEIQPGNTEEVPKGITRGLRQAAGKSRKGGLKAPAPRQGPRLETPIASLLGEEVSYGGVTGTLRQDENGTVIVTPVEGLAIEVEGALKDLSKTAESLGVAYTPKRTFDLKADGTLTIGDVQYSSPVVNKNKVGEPVSLTVVGPKGIVTLKNPQLAVDVTLALANQAATERQRSTIRPQPTAEQSAADVLAKRRLLTGPPAPAPIVPRGTTPVIQETLTTPTDKKSLSVQPPLAKKESNLASISSKLDALEDANDMGEPAEGLAEARQSYQQALLERDVELYKVKTSEDLLRELRERAYSAQQYRDAFDSQRVRQLAVELYRRGENPEALLAGRISADEAEILRSDLQAIKSTLNESRSIPASETPAATADVVPVGTANNETPPTPQQQGTPTTEVGKLPDTAPQAGEEAADKTKRFVKGKPRGQNVLDTPGGLPGGRPFDLLDHIKANFKIRSRRNAPEGTEGYYTPEQAEAQKRFPDLFSPTGELPDVALQILREDGAVSQDMTVSDLWPEMIGTQDARKAWFESKKNETASFDRMAAQNDRFVRAKQRHSEDPTVADEVFPETLSLGATFKVGGETFTVTEVDTYETGRPKLVTVSDGKKFGDQQLKAGEPFYPDKGTIKFKPEPAKAIIPEKVTPEEWAKADSDLRKIQDRRAKGDTREGDGAEMARLQKILGQTEMAIADQPSVAPEATKPTNQQVMREQQQAPLRAGGIEVQDTLFGEPAPESADIPLFAQPVPKVQITPEGQSRGPGGNIEAVTDLATGRSFVQPNTPAFRRAQLRWHEVAVHAGLQSALVKGQDRIEIDRLVSQADRFLNAEADALAKAAGFSDAAAMRKSYGFADGPEGDAAMRWELLARKAEQLAGQPKPSWWRTLIGRIQLWIAKRFNFRLSESGVEALIRMGAKRMEGVEMETAVIENADGMSDVVFSQKPASSEAEYRKQTMLDPRMPAPERERIQRAKYISNEVAVGPVETEFAALPPEVKAELPQLTGRLNAKRAAAMDLKGVVPPRQTLRDMAVATSPNIEDQTAAMFEGTNNIFELVDSVNDLEAKVEATKKEVKSLKDAESKRDQSYPAAATILTEARRRLTDQRARAEAAGNATLADSINRAIGDLQNRENAVAQVLKMVATGMPPAVLTSPTTTPLDVSNWMATGATGRFSTETGALVASSPDIVRHLRVVAGLESPAVVQAAEANLKAQTDALAFMRRTLANPEFRNNYEQAVEWSGSAGVRKEVDGNPHYENPYNPEDTRTIYPDYDQATWEKNQAAFSDVRQWLERYIQDPKADPLKREGYKFALAHLELMQSQSFAPERGKVAPSALWNPSYLLIRAIPKFFDVPEHILELIGGRLAYQTYYDLANLSEIGERMTNTHNRTRLATQKATVAAGKSAGYTGTANQIVNRWQQDIGNPIFASYQTRGDRRLKIGDMVNGHKITKSDMDAVESQKRYIDGVLAALKSIRKGESATTQGKFSPIRTLDVIGKAAFEREAQDTSGLTVPQKLKPITRQFVDAWMHPDADRSALVNDPTYWRPVLSHVESFGNPDYRSFVDSPFAHEYIDIADDIAQTGNAPASLDALANDLFARLGGNINLQTMSVDEIKAQCLLEINKVVRATEMERASHPTLVKDSPDVGMMSAENFFNRPRGERLLPKGFYDYTTGTEEQMSSLRTAAKEIYTHRLLKSATEMRDALTAKRAAQFQRVQQGLATASTSRKAVQDGTELVHLTEIDRLIPQLNRFISDFTQMRNRAREDERDIYSMVNVARGWLSNSLLQRFGTLWRNAGGGVLNSSLMDREMLSQGRNIFYRNALIHPIWSSIKGARRQGESFITTATGLLGGTERGKRISKALATNKTILGNWGGDIAQWIDRQAARVEEMERLAIITPQHAAENIGANMEFMQQRGRITTDLETPGKLRSAGRAGVAAMEIAQELGLPLLQLPRSLGSPLIDTAVNAASRVQVQDMLDTLHMQSVRSLNTRMMFGPLDPKTAVLSPQEVFGLTGKSTTEMQRALTALRQEFAKAGISLDRYLVEYHQAVQRAPGTNPQVLTPEQLNSLQFEMATRMNKGTMKNRPMWNNNATKLAMTFLGYGINQNARLAQFLGSWSRDARKVDPASFARAAYIVGTLAVLGPLLTFLPIKLIEKLLYNEDKPVKDLWETEGAGEFALTALRQSYGVLPVIGQVLNYTLGSLTGAGSQGQFSLLPISLATAAANLVNKGIRTGEWERPLVEFVRQWMPNSRIVINRLALREGLTNESAMRSALAANAPAGVEVKAMRSAGGIRQYSVISGQLDNIVNALSRSGGPDMATATAERQDAIARLVELGATEADAGDTVDRAVLARDPYRSTYGRELTQREKADLRSRLDDAQATVLDTVENGRQTYATTFGMKAPDFVALRGRGVEAEAQRLGLPSPAEESRRMAGGGGSSRRMGAGRSTGSLRLGSGGRARSSSPIRTRGLRRGTVVGLRRPRRSKSPRFPSSRRLGSRRVGARLRA